MIPASLDSNYQLSYVLCLIFILLVPFAIAGLALINAGLGRSRSAAHAITSSLCVAALAILIYFVWGFAIQGYGNAQPPQAELNRVHTLFLGNVRWGSGSSLAVLLSVFSVALSSQIPVGAGADRWRMSAALISTILFAGCIFPIFAHLSYGLWTIGGQINDAGGSGVINATGGLAALSVAWLLGPRHGKYSGSGMPAAIPAHNGVFVVFGCTLAWTGWLGLNCAGSVLNPTFRYASTPILETSSLVVINTTLAAAAAGLAAAATTRIRFRRPDASLIANGWMAGLVASSAGCAVFKPAIAILVGMVAGLLVVVSVEFFEFTLKVDDPCGSVSVHAVCGIWGLLAAGIFASVQGQLLTQLVGVATLLGFVLPLAYGLNWLLGRVIPYRVSIDGERQGLDLHELGADAYPEFVVHADEFIQR